MMKKECIKYILVFFTLIFIFFSYSTLVALLPTKNIKKNIEKSISEMAPEGTYPKGMINKKQYQMDNFTDALILSQNYSIDNRQPVTSALVPKYAKDTAINVFNSTIRQVEHNDVHLISYPRYWHGNTFLLRPFLLFTDYSEIRWILYVISSLLFLILGIKLFQIFGMIKTFAFFLGLWFVNIFITQFSIQLFVTVSIAIIACILMCNHYHNRKKILLLAFIFGALTSYFDLLTTPLLTCGLPLIVYLSAEKEDVFKKRFSSLVAFVLLWSIGYALTWCSKWALATIFTDINVFKDALHTASYRISSEDFSRCDAVIENYKLLPNFFIYLILTLLLPFIVMFFNKKEIKTNILLLIVVTFPYLWFLVVAQHSWWHWWFTYRIQAISIIALFFICINFISWDKIEKLIHKKKE